MPRYIDRVQDAKGRVRVARMTIKRAKVKMPRAKERKGKEIRKDRQAIARAKVKAKTRKAKVWQHVTHTCGKVGHLSQRLEEQYLTGSQ